MSFVIDVEHDSVMTLTISVDGGFAAGFGEPSGLEEYRSMQPLLSEELRLFLDQWMDRLFKHYRRTDAS